MREYINYLFCFIRTKWIDNFKAQIKNFLVVFYFCSHDHDFIKSIHLYSFAEFLSFYNLKFSIWRFRWTNLNPLMMKPSLNRIFFVKKPLANDCIIWVFLFFMFLWPVKIIRQQVINFWLRRPFFAEIKTTEAIIGRVQI